MTLLLCSLVFLTTTANADTNSGNSNKSDADQSSKPAQSVANSLHVKGIYVTQYNLENTAFLNHLIKHAKSSGIDTFVVDLELPSTRYKNNIALLKANHINYIARIIMFPDGGKADQIKNPAYWQRKYKLALDPFDGLKNGFIWMFKVIRKGHKMRGINHGANGINAL